MQVPQPGEVFESRYKLLEVLGQGGFGIVFRARQIGVGRDVAIKVLLPRDGGYPEGLVGRFMREANLVASLTDPHTITMFDFGRSETGLLYMVTEYLPGTTVEQLLTDQGALRPADALHVLEQVAHSLREAHGQGILHRDIKPANIIVYSYMEDPFRVKLLDFGVAKSVEGAGVDITAEGALVGTPRYMSPEQLSGERLTAASDIYSLGLVLYEMLTGQECVDARKPKDVMVAHLCDDEFTLPVELPDTIRGLLGRMLAKSPDTRLASADALLATIDELQRSDSHGTDDPRDASEPAKGASASVLIAVGIAVLLVLAGVMWIFYGGETPDLLNESGAHGTDPAELPTQLPATNGHSAAADANVLPVGDGCGRPHEPGWVEASFSRDDQTIDYLVWIPDSYDDNGRHAAFLGFHPRFSGARAFAEGAELLELAGSRDALLVLPLDAGHDWTDDSPTKLRLLEGVVASVESDYCVERDHWFALGLSDGAAMADMLRCSSTVDPVGVALVSHLGGGQSCDLNEPTPAIFFNGLKDPIAPPDGSPGCTGNRYSSLELLHETAKNKRACEGEPETWYASDQGHCLRWTCDRELITCTVDDGRHEWSGSSRLAAICPDGGSHWTSSQFPTSDLIGRFFDRITSPQP